MTRDEKIETLNYWVDFGLKAEVLRHEMDKVLGSAVDMPIIQHYYRLFTDYTALVSTLVGDTADWLEWFAWENDFGRKEMEAGYDGNLKPVRNVPELLDLIETN